MEHDPARRVVVALADVATLAVSESTLIDPHAQQEPAPSESPADPPRLDPAVVAALFVEHADELRRFVLGVLRNHEQAADVLQLTFVKAIERGHSAREESLKGWLFRVAYNEAIVIRRRQSVHHRALDALAAIEPRGSAAPDVPVLRSETIERVRTALEQLSPEQRRVVSLRMYDQKKFVEIARELDLPLGTVLTRMQLALKKLRKFLEP